MSAGSGDSHLSKAERRNAAREKARQLREEQKKKERRNRFLIQGGIIVAILAVIAVVALVIVNAVRPPAVGPQNMLSDGIKIGQNFEAVRTPGLRPGSAPVPAQTNEPDVLDIQIWVDYMCPYCGGFERANAEQLSQLVESGSATLEIHPISFLDRASAGTQYSTRAANAAACVANYSPDKFFAFNQLLFANQPAEGTAGLSNDELIQLTKQVGVSRASDIVQCVESQKFKSWVKGATDRALNGPVAGTELEKIQGTPTVLVNGQQYQYTINPKTNEFDPDEFARFLTQVLGSQFIQEPTPTPTPPAGG